MVERRFRFEVTGRGAGKVGHAAVHDRGLKHWQKIVGDIGKPDLEALLLKRPNALADSGGQSPWLELCPSLPMKPSYHRSLTLDELEQSILQRQFIGRMRRHTR